MRTLLSAGDYGLFEGPADDQVVFAHYRKTGTWAAEVLALLHARFGSGAGTFIDAGANIGLVTIPLLERTAAEAYAFEPAPENFELLTRNIARHDLSRRVRAHRVALHARAGTQALSLSRTNAGDHHLGDDPERKRITVETARLDDVLSGRPLATPVVMKVDTQGSELHVLLGARETLKRVDHLLIEYWPLGLARCGHRPRDLWPELLQFPYAGLVDQHGGEPRMEPTEQLLERLSFFSDLDPGFFDLLLGRSL